VLEGESFKAALEHFSKGERARRVRLVGLDPKDADLRAVASVGSELVVDRADQQMMKPGVEAAGVTQTGRIPPAADQRLVGGVLGAVGVAEHQAGDRVQPIDDAARQGVERLAIAASRPLDQLELRHRAPASGLRLWFIPYWRGQDPKGSPRDRAAAIAQTWTGLRSVRRPVLARAWLEVGTYGPIRVQG
jgi:hypothetical protein